MGIQEMQVPQWEMRHNILIIKALDVAPGSRSFHFGTPAQSDTA
jgi:hypothetical protein